MKNIPRVFLGDEIMSGKVISAPSDIAHYLSHVMRTDKCLVFGGRNEYTATLDGKNLIVGNKTDHDDVARDITLMFAPIKRCDDLINMATQLGVGILQPVITERTVARNINWSRMEKIAIEAAEQSGRNSVPKILSPIKFSEIDLSKIAFADERAAHGKTTVTKTNIKTILVGPEGGFSDAEFAALDNAGAFGVCLGKTILRAELAAAIAITRVE